MPALNPIVYMKSNVKVEPLSCRWYAWGHILSPLQLALNITNRQLPLLKSFIANPATHLAAANDPALLSAPFVQLEEQDLPAVADLVASIAQQCGRLIQMSEDWIKLDRQIQQSANGYSLEEAYGRIPNSLRGLVELTYDLKNNPRLRPIEELIDQSEFDTPAMQEIQLSTALDRDRKFFLNTPRLETADNVILPMPFADARLDRIAATRLGGMQVAQLLEDAAVPCHLQEKFLQFFTTMPPERNTPNYDGQEVRVRYFGHACVLVQTSNLSILIDPVVVCGNEEPEAKLTFDDLPDVIDYVFLTHNHHDHFCPEYMLQLRHRIRNVLVPPNNVESIADPSLKLILRRLGFSNVTVMNPLDKITTPDGDIVSLPFYGEHADLNIHSKHGMFLRLKGRTLAFLADSNGLDRCLYHRIVERLGKVDTLFIGMECDGAPMSWLYSPYFFDPIKRKDDKSRRLSGSDSKRAWAIVEELGCTQVFVYAMGQEPWLKHLAGLQYTPDSKQLIESNAFIAMCRHVGIPAERLYGCREMIF